MEKIRKKTRIWELDFIRGVCVLLMICDHILFDLGFIFRGEWFPHGGGSLLYQLCSFAYNVYWEHPLRLALRVAVLVCFFGICGVCCSFSRSNFRRGLKLLGVALLLTAATALLDLFSGTRDYYIIRFGVLHMLAVSILLYALLQSTGRIVQLAAGAALVAAGLYFGAHPLAVSGLFPYILGIGGGSYSADYFPVAPWSGYLLIGAALGALLYKNKSSYFPLKGKGKLLRPMEFVGRHALWFYLLHQPAVYGLLLLVGLLPRN